MEIQIKNIGQLEDVNIRLVKRINLLYAENGTGKTTLSRTLDSLRNPSSFDKIKAYCGNNHKVAIKFDNDTNNELILTNNKWNRESRNFYVFNEDYYSESIISTLGEEIYIGSADTNRLRSFLKLWKLMLDINNITDEDAFFEYVLTKK